MLIWNPQIKFVERNNFLWIKRVCKFYVVSIRRKLVQLIVLLYDNEVLEFALEIIQSRSLINLILTKFDHFYFSTVALFLFIIQTHFQLFLECEWVLLVLLLEEILEVAQVRSCNLGVLTRGFSLHVFEVSFAIKNGFSTWSPAYCISVFVKIGYHLFTWFNIVIKIRLIILLLFHFFFLDFIQINNLKIATILISKNH